MNNPQDEIGSLLFDVRRSIRYHQRRRNFFETLDKTINFFSVIFGSATVYGVFQNGHPNVIAFTSVTVSVFSGLSLVFGLSDRAHLHLNLARDFIRLQQKLAKNPSPTQEDIASFKVERLSIEADEPATLRVLDSICYNEQVISDGHDDSETVTINWCQRVVADFFDLQAYKLKKKDIIQSK